VGKKGLAYACQLREKLRGIIKAKEKNNEKVDDRLGKTRKPQTIVTRKQKRKEGGGRKRKRGAGLVKRLRDPSASPGEKKKHPSPKESADPLMTQKKKTFLMDRKGKRICLGLKVRRGAPSSKMRKVGITESH